MGNGIAEGALTLGALGIDVDPLVVAGGIGEVVDPLLGDLEPVAGLEWGTDQQDEFCRGFDGEHAAPWGLGERYSRDSVQLCCQKPD